MAGKGMTLNKTRIVRVWFAGVMATDAGFSYRLGISDNLDMQAKNAPGGGNFQ